MRLWALLSLEHFLFGMIWPVQATFIHWLETWHGEGRRKRDQHSGTVAGCPATFHHFFLILPACLLIHRAGKMKHSFFFFSQCKVYSRCNTPILSCPQAFSVLCYSSQLKKGSLPFTHTGDCSTGSLLLSKALYSDWRRKKIVRKLLLTEEQLNPPILLPILKMQKSVLWMHKNTLQTKDMLATCNHLPWHRTRGRKGGDQSVLGVWLWITAEGFPHSGFCPLALRL